MAPGCDWTASTYSALAAERLARELGVAHPVATILVRRGYHDPELARGFLDAADSHDPHELDGIADACALILGHVERGSGIVVFGDYDVDGVCATALLVRALRALGATPAWELPSRFEEGYGLSLAAIERSRGAGADLLITVDCGITAVEEVAAARAAGIDVVVTDHHRPGPAMPDCPVVHPGLGAYPCPDLCGTGVAHKLAEALVRDAGADAAIVAEDLDLVALATTCDIVPLRGENRRLVREGLSVLSRTQKPGLRALMRAARLDPGRVNARSAGFSLGPRLNAAGRLQRADAALELLLTEDEQRAGEVAAELEALNRERRDTELRITFAAEAAAAPRAHEPALVLAGRDWHPGVIGIVASRLVDRYHRPCVLVALDGEVGRGSGRSIRAYDLHAGLTACATHLRRFGGHRMAAGFDIDAEAVERFGRDLAKHAAGALCPSDLKPVERVDAVVSASALGLALAEELDRLGPFGHGNPAPALLVPAARVDEVGRIGADRQHARLSLAGGGRRARVVAFRTSPGSLGQTDGPRDAVVRLEAREWNGMLEPALELRAICPTADGPVEPLGRFWDGALAELRGDPGGWVADDAVDSPRRELSDRREAGIAGVAGELITSGEGVLLVCAHVGARLRGLRAVLGGLRSHAGEPDAAAGARVATAVSWDALAADPELAAPFEHVVAVDPPPLPEGERLLRAAPAPSSGGLAHLAWGEAELDFALAVAGAELDLRSPLAELYRSLREVGEARGDPLEALLRGDRGNRSPALCGRLLRVLDELELVELAPAQDGGLACRLTEAQGRVELESSLAFRAYAARLERTRSHLAPPVRGAPMAAVA